MASASSNSAVDILEDGGLDLPDSILKRLVDLPADKQTARVLRAMDNPYFNIMCHPTGRLVGSRDGYPLDMEQVMQAALERRCFLELNAEPHRLDLCDVHCRMAKEIGLKVAISPIPTASPTWTVCALASIRRGAAGSSATTSSTREAGRS